MVYPRCGSASSTYPVRVTHRSLSTHAHENTSQVPREPEQILRRIAENHRVRWYVRLYETRVSVMLTTTTTSTVTCVRIATGLVLQLRSPKFVMLWTAIPVVGRICAIKPSLPSVSLQQRPDDGSSDVCTHMSAAFD